jgi:hypothetical protein
MTKTRVIRGRRIGTDEVHQIQLLLAEFPLRNRTFLSQELCRQWNWKTPTGALKEVAARELLLRLERMNEIRLPQRENPGNNHLRRGDWVTSVARAGLFVPPGFLETPQTGHLSDFGSVTFSLMKTRAEQKFWNSLIHQHHYLGYRPVAGFSVKYLIHLAGHVVGGISFSAPLWKLGIRDQFIGWEEPVREANRHHIANNNRFLILPWIKIKYLASHILSRVVSPLCRDFRSLYHTPIYLLETLVDRSRFQGTSYKAANWICLGTTKGMSKRGLSFYTHGQKKDVYVYPITTDFRERLAKCP